MPPTPHVAQEHCRQLALPGACSLVDIHDAEQAVCLESLHQPLEIVSICYYSRLRGELKLASPPRRKVNLLVLLSLPEARNFPGTKLHPGSWVRRLEVTQRLGTPKTQPMSRDKIAPRGAPSYDVPAVGVQGRERGGIPPHKQHTLASWLSCLVTQETMCCRRDCETQLVNHMFVSCYVPKTTNRSRDRDINRNTCNPRASTQAQAGLEGKGPAGAIHVIVRIHAPINSKNCLHWDWPLLLSMYPVTPPVDLQKHESALCQWAANGLLKGYKPP